MTKKNSLKPPKVTNLIAAGKSTEGWPAYFTSSILFDAVSRTIILAPALIFIALSGFKEDEKIFPILELLQIFVLNKSKPL